MLAASQPSPAWMPPPDAEWLGLLRHPAVAFILGKRDSGKSALGYRLLELLRNQAAPYVVGLPAAARKLLPDWVGCADRLEDVPPKAVVLLDAAIGRLMNDFVRARQDACRLRFLRFASRHRQ